MAEQVPAPGRGTWVPAEAGPTAGLPAVPTQSSFGLGPPEEIRFDWRRALAAVLRHKWLVLATVVLGTAGGVVGSRFVPPTYVAQANIWLPAQTRRDEARAAFRPDPLFAMAGWIELIKTSFVVLDDVVQDLRLYLSVQNPEDSLAFSTFRLKERFVPGDYDLDVAGDGRTFVLRTRQGVVIQRSAVGDSIGAEIGFGWQPPAGSLRAGRTVRFSVDRPRTAALNLQQEISARVNERGAGFLAVRLEGKDPRAIAAIVNQVAYGFVDTARALASAKHRELLRTLTAQLDSAERKLHDAEIALEVFQVETYTLPRERATPIAPGLDQTTNPALDNYTQMQFELDGLERDREAIEAALAAGGVSGLAPDALLYIGAVQNSAQLSAALRDLTEREATVSALRLRYTEEYPELVRAQNDIRELRQRTIPDLTRGLLAQLSSRERELQARIGSAGRELRQIPRRATDQQRFKREVEIAAYAYQILKQQYQDAIFAQSADDLGARVLDEAVVLDRPIRNMAYRIIGMAFLASLGLGIAAAVLLDRIDRRVRYPDQVSRDLGLPILGAIPRISSPSNGRAAVPGRDTTQVIEALRGVRLGLVHAHGAAGPLVVTVTSPGPGEGKSFVVSNLALAFADAGHRTLLIDGDVRRGELHRLLGTVRKPGLTDFLNGGTGSGDVIQATRYDRLHFVGGGTRSHGAPELLASTAMHQFLLSLRSAYDVILLDSPPMAAGIDPFVLGTATGNLLLVLRTGRTDRELAEAKLDVLDRLPVRVLGAILNDVRPTGAYRYYGYEYYVQGYETQQEDGGAPRAQTLGAGGDAD